MPSTSVEDQFLPRRFDLIKKMYCSDKVIALNKKDLIFNWFFEQFRKHKNEIYFYKYELLWKTFQEILLNEKENKSGHRILIKSDAVKNLLAAIKKYPYGSPQAYVILQSVGIFLQTPTVNATLIADIDLMLQFLVATLNVLRKILRFHRSDELSLKEAKLLGNEILDILENLPYSYNILKVQILTDSLRAVALFIYVIDGKKEFDGIGDKLINRIINTIFNLKTKKYESLLATVLTAEEDYESPNEKMLIFFLSLQKFLMSEDTSHQSVFLTAAVALFMKKLLTAFLSQHKHDLHALKVTSLFFAIAGLDIPIINSQNSCCNALFKSKIENAEMNITSICDLLEACTTASQYFTSVMAPEEYKRPLVWLKDVYMALLDVKISKNKSAWLKCFQFLLKITPSTDVFPLIKMGLLNISVHSIESKKEYCNLFDIILQAHSQLRQLPKFFVKLLLALTECIKQNSYGKFLENGQVLPQVQESIAKCIRELPHGQMIELWKMYIETFSTLETMTQIFNVSKSIVFFVAQIFSTFLLHAQLFQPNIPSNAYNSIATLIEKTSAEIQKNISVLKETDQKEAPFQKSLLLLSFALGEVKLAYIAYYEQLPNVLASPISDNPFDFSLVHYFLGENFSSTLESVLRNEDKILSVLVFQLLLQKVKAFQFKDLSIEYPSSFKKLISVILENLQVSSSAMGHWNSDMSAINEKNYGTVFWKMFLKTLPLVLNSMSYKNVQALTYTLVQKILLDASTDIGVKSVILSSLHHEFFQESKPFRIAFISALCASKNKHRKRSYDEMNEEIRVENLPSLIIIESLDNSESPKKLNVDEISNLVKIDSGDNYEWSIELIQQLVLPKPRNDQSSNASEQCDLVNCSKQSLLQNSDFEVTNENLMMLPKRILLQKLHGLKLNSETYEKFIDTFNAFWEVLYKIVLQNKSLGLSSAIIITFIGKLLKFFVKSSGTYAHLSESREVQLCALNMNRLLIALARHETEVSKLVPYLIADYIDTVQHVTLAPNIKEAIVLGIFRLLDICSEESIKMLTVNISYICREIYVNLIKNYRQSKCIRK